MDYQGRGVIGDMNKSSEIRRIKKIINKTEESFSEGNYEVGSKSFYNAIRLSKMIFQEIQEQSKINNYSMNEKESVKFYNIFTDHFKHHDFPRNGDNIAVISDSIGLDRISIGLEMDGTYSFLLQNHLINDGFNLRVAPFCQRNRTSQGALQFIKNSEILHAQPPSFLILQLGIVDCAPRVFGVHDAQALRSVCGDDYVQQMLELSTKFRGKLIRPWTTSAYVKLADFSKNIKNIALYAKHILRTKHIFIVNIVKPSKNGKIMAFGSLSEAVDAYNSNMKQLVNSKFLHLIDANSYIWKQENVLDFFTNDNYHYNKVGHEAISKFIYSSIKPYLNPASVGLGPVSV